MWYVDLRLRLAVQNCDFKCDNIFLLDFAVRLYNFSPPTHRVLHIRLFKFLLKKLSVRLSTGSVLIVVPLL